MSSTAENESVCRAFTEEVTNNLDSTHLDQYKDPGYRVHRSGFHNLHELTGRPIVEPGNTDPIGGFRALHRAFEGWNAQITEMAAVGDQVWTRLDVTGLHVGDFLGIPASGNLVNVTEVGVRRFRNGRMTDGWWIADEIGLLRQIGVDLTAALRPRES